MHWYVYILECADQTLYTGVTNDLKRRIAEHNAKDSKTKYTRVRQPVRLVYSENTTDKNSALKREYELKKFSRAEKQQLISSAH